MNFYYVSLCRDLIGYFILFEAPDETVVREHLSKYYGKMWCSVYTEKPTKFNPKIINNTPIVLNSEDWE